MDALRGLMAEVGFAGVELARELEDGTLQLIDGHARAEIAGEAEVPVVILDVTEAEADKILATFDPVGKMAGADPAQLEALLADVETGSEALQAMLDALASEYQQEAEAPEIVEDEAPDPPTVPITQPGDLWILGDHRLLCGDSTKAEDVATLLDGAHVDMVLTDPPYGVSYVGKTADALVIQNDQLDEDGLALMIAEAFDHAEAACRPGAYWYATVSPGPLHLVFADDWKRRGILRQIMVWVKDSMVLGHSEYHYKHEPILFGWVPGERHRNRDRTRTTVWTHERPKQSREHPTMKPVALWAQAITDGSREGELILDPFLGSGTTLIAATQLGRTCYGLEISPAYCDVIVKRWEALTGETAERISREQTCQT